MPLTARENMTLGTPSERGDAAVLEAARASGADRIVVMASGRIVESRGYQELLAKPGGLFAELHRLQDGTD